MSARRHGIATGLGLVGVLVSADAYGFEAIELPAPPNTSAPTGFVKGVGGTLGPIALSGELVQGMRLTDNLQQDTTDIPGAEYIPSMSLTGVAVVSGTVLGVTGTFTGEYPTKNDLPIEDDTDTLSGFATKVFSPSTTGTFTLDYSKTNIESLTTGQFHGEIGDDIWSYTATAVLTHQTDTAFIAGTAEHNEFITELTTDIGGDKDHTDMDRSEDRLALQGGIIGSAGERYYLTAEVNRFAYEAADLHPHDSTVVALGGGVSGTFGDFVLAMDVQGFHKRFRGDLPNVTDVEAALSVNWKVRQTTTLIAVFGRVFEETNLLTSPGIDADQIYVSWLEQPTDRFYVQGTFLYSYFKVRGIGTETDAWKVYFDAGYAITPNVYLRLSATHAEQRTDSANIDFGATQVEFTTHFTF